MILRALHSLTGGASFFTLHTNSEAEVMTQLRDRIDDAIEMQVAIAGRICLWCM